MVSDTHKATIVKAEAVEVQRMHPVVASAMQQGQVDPTTLRELLAVQREWEAGEARKAYTRALAALKADLPTVIERDATVDYTSQSGKRTHYTHATLAGAMDAVTGPLTAHGFSLSWTPATAERGVRVTCRLTHREGHFEECTLDAPPDDSGNKNKAQAIASTITLLSRYTALALLGIATRDMKEPAGEGQADGRVDATRTLAAIGAIQKAGLALADAEAVAGKPAKDWTGAELAKVREWFDARKPKRAPRENADGSLADDPPVG